MSVEQTIVAALGPLVGGRIYPDAFPLKPLPTWPALRYTLTGGDVGATSCGSGAPDSDDTTLQIDAVAETSAARAALRDQVRAALAAMAPPAVLAGPPMQDFDAETRTFRATFDVTIYSSSSP